MRFNKRHLIVLLILLAAAVIICAASAHEASAAKTSKITVKIHNFKPGVLWATKARILKNGDAIAGYVEYKGNMQFSKGTGVTSKVKTKTVKGSSAHLSTKLIKGYTPYKAVVWYTTQ